MLSSDIHVFTYKIKFNFLFFRFIGEILNSNDDCIKDIQPYYNLKEQHLNPIPMVENVESQLLSEGYSYVSEVPALSSSYRPSHKKIAAHQYSGIESIGGNSSIGEVLNQYSRTRRCQRRVTHNEKRYHSGTFI